MTNQETLRRKRAVETKVAEAREVQKQLDLAKENQELHKKLEAVAEEKGAQERQIGGLPMLTRVPIGEIAILGRLVLALLALRR